VHLGIPALIQTHGQFFAIGIGRHVIGRSLATMEGHGASSFGMYLLLLPFYFVTIFVSFFPWSIKLPWLIRQLRRQKKAGISNPCYSGNEIDKYLLTGIAVIFVIFTLVSTKLPHYTLPAFPLLALLLARHWQGAASATNHRSSFRTIATSATCVCIAVALVVPPLVARFFPAYQLFRESHTYLQTNTQFASVEFEEPSLVWYFRSRVQGFLTAQQKRMQSTSPIEVRTAFKLCQRICCGDTLGIRRRDWKMFSTRGWQCGQGKFVDLTLVLKPGEEHGYGFNETTFNYLTIG
jgi:hypothetical protein